MPEQLQQYKTERRIKETKKKKKEVTELERETEYDKN